MTIRLTPLVLLAALWLLGSCSDSSESPIADPNYEGSTVSDPNYEASTVSDVRQANIQINEIRLDQTVDGVSIQRRALIAIPDVGPRDGDDQLSLLVAFHGRGGQPEDLLRDFLPMLSKHSFAALIPEGLELSWNLGREASSADDAAFVDALLQHLGQTTDVNLDRVFAYGHSNGAGLVHRLLAERPWFSAGVTSASALSDDFVPSTLVPAASLLSLHGTEDREAPYAGGFGAAGHNFLPVEHSSAIWAEVLGCPPQPDQGETSGGNIRLQWSPCRGGHQVVHYGFVGFGHGLPPSLEGGLKDLIFDFFQTVP